jgi:hypothetical protein
MIRKIYVIHDSGVCLYDFDFLAIGRDHTGYDPQLISGFFVALFQFGESQITNIEGAAHVNFIAFKNLNYYFEKVKNMFVVIEMDQSDKNFAQEDARAVMDYTVDLYQDYVAKGFFDKLSSEFHHNSNFEVQIKDFIAQQMRQKLFNQSITP